MNLNDILQFYRPDDYKVYTEGKKILNEEKQAKSGNVSSKPKEVNKDE